MKDRRIDLAALVQPSPTRHNAFPALVKSGVALQRSLAHANRADLISIVAFSLQLESDLI
jgi:hypothetical protein